jgi:hypothetical protein
LLQVLGNFPGVRHWGSFIASTPSFFFRRVTDDSILRQIGGIVPGECLGAHLYFNAAYAELIERQNVAHFFIYRDPRDVVVSEAHYLTYMNRWHRLHKYFANELRDDDERIMAAIVGIPGNAGYPDIGTRVKRYLSWIKQSHVFALKYEELNSESRRDLVASMVQFYAARAAVPVEEPKVVELALEGIDPLNSHTFNQGTSGKWRALFTDQHARAFELSCGGVMEELGYPCD